MLILDLTLLVAIVIGFVEIAKHLGLPSRFAPLLSVAFAILFNFLIMWAGAATGELILTGAIAGLTASGLWDIGKHTIAGK